MSSYQSPVDLEKQGQGALASSEIRKPSDIGLGMYFEITRQTQLIEQSLAELKKIRNKLWNIEDVLSTKPEPEFEVEEK